MSDLKIKLIKKKYEEERLWSDLWEKKKTRPAAESELEETSPSVGPGYISQYTSYDEMETILADLELKYPDIALRYSIGLSEEGRQLWCLKITSDVKSSRKTLKPMVKFVANIHGDETVGRELLIGNYSLQIPRPFPYLFLKSPDLT